MIQISSLFNGSAMTVFFIKAFSIVFAILFFIYTLISYRQVIEVTRAILNDRNKIIAFISLLQVFIALGLLVFSILFV